MPHTKSAEKRLRQNEKRRLHNKAVLRALKKQVKKFLAAAEAGPGEGTAAEFKLAVKKLDKAAAKRIIHPNAAARKKSQLAAVLNEAVKA